MKAIVTVIGKDRVGIIAEVCAILAKNDINILDISQTTSASPLSFSELSALLHDEGEKNALSIRIQREDIFEAMHRI